MLIIAGIFLLIIGLIMTISPTAWFELTQSWKSYSAADPSDLFIIVTRIGGIMFLLAAVAAFIVQFIG